MDTTPDESPRDPKPVPLSEIVAMANRIAYIAGRYKEIAEKAEGLGLDRLLVTGRPTAERGEGFIKTWMGTLQTALDDQVMGQPDSENVKRNIAKIKERKARKDS